MPVSWFNFILANVPPLPDPHWLERYWLADPLPLTLAFIFIGIAIFITGSRSEKRQQQIIGISTTLLAIPVFLFSIFHTTTREHLMAETQNLIDAAVITMNDPSKQSQFKSMLNPSVRFSVKNGRALTQSKDDLTQMISNNVNAYKVSDAQCRNLQAVVSDSGLRAQTQTTIHSKVAFAGFERNARTTFKFTWQKSDPDQPWRLRELEFLEVNGNQVPESVWRD